MFEEGKPNHYKAQNVSEIEDFDPDQYGNIWYNVKFEGNAETFMWLAKNPPEEGKEYYGHIEPTKSGKRLRFKTDKLPEGENTSHGSSNGYKNNPKDITLGMVWKTVAGIRGLPESDEEMAKFFEIVQSHLNELLLISEKMNEEARPQS